MSRRFRRVRRATATLVLVLALVSVAGCENDSDDSMGPTQADLNGRWVFAADSASPPATQACTGDLATAILTPFCSSFDLVLDQSGSGFSGDGSETFCGATWTASGAVFGPGFSGNAAWDDGSQVVRFSFEGTLSSPDAGVLSPRTLTVDGLTGNCTVFGRFFTSRVPQPGP